MRRLAACLIPFLLTCASAAQISWMPQTHLSPRGGHAMAFDPVQKQVVLVGGNPGGNDTWGFQGKAWVQQPAGNRLGTRYGHAMAFDAKRNRMVVFGGRTTTGDLDDTWEWDGVTWREIKPTTRPPARANGKMVYDAVRGKVLLFGGSIIRNYQSVFFGGVWEWSGTNWTKLTVTGGPSARGFHAMAYDATRKRVVVRGGWDALSSGLTDTWEFDGTKWTERTTTTKPMVHRGATAWYDPVAKATMLFGYIDFPRTPFPARQELWALDGQGWRFVSLAPFAAIAPTIAHDPLRKRAVYFSSAADTWEYDGSGWTRIASGGSPGYSFFTTNTMTFDSHRGVFVFVQGTAHLNTRISTWEHDGQRWTPRSGVGGPLIRRGQVISYDSDRKRVMLFGGESPYGNNQTWEYDGTTWTQLNPKTKPPSLDDPALVYDPVRRETVLHGASTYSRGGVTYTWNGTDWTKKTPTTQPWGRVHARAVWHAKRQTIVLYAGSDPTYANVIKGDLWEWNGKAWTQLAKTVPAGTRGHHQMAYDSHRETVVIYGGRRGSAWLTDTWEWGPNGWAERKPTQNPGRNLHIVMGYDSIRRRSMLFGGETIATWTCGPDFPATTATFGTGCAGTAGTPALAAQNLPWLGDTFTETASNMVPNAPGMLIVGVSNTTWNGAALPLDLSFLRMPGCRLLASFDVLLPLQADALGKASVRVKIPVLANLRGGWTYKQVYASDPAANGFGGTTSNGLAVRMGAR